MTFLLGCAVRMSVIFCFALIANRMLLRKRSAALRHGVLSLAVFSAGLFPAISLVTPEAWSLPIPAPFLSVKSTEMPVQPERPRAPGPQGKVREPAVSGAGESVQQPVAPVNNNVPAAAADPTTPTPGTSPAPGFMKSLLFVWTDVSPMQVVALVWIAGGLFGLATLGLGLAQLTWMARRSQPIGDGLWKTLVEEASARHGLRRTPTILQSSDPALLATWGTLRPKLMLPAGAAGWPEQRIRVALYHEFAHVKRHDWLTQIFAEVERAVLWFNPLPWMISAQLARESEQACDDAALRCGIESSIYAAELLELARTLGTPRRAWSAALSMAGPSTIERRFVALLNPHLDRSAITRWGSVVMATVSLGIVLPLVALTFSASASVLRPSRNPEPAESPTKPSKPALRQDPLPATAIEGVVIDLNTHDPIGGAEVELIRVKTSPANDQALPHVITAQDGRFAFKDLDPGEYRIAAARKGGAYTPVEYGQHDPRGRGITFPVLKGQTVENVRLEMAPTGVIAGRVVDDQGEPMSHVTVMALEPRYKDGRRSLSITETVQTGFNGEYRLYWLPPGLYYVAAKVEDLGRRTIPISINEPGTVELNDRVSPPVLHRRTLASGEVVDEVFAIVYFGGATDPDKAAPINLAAGAVTSAADISMGIGRMPARHIRGIVFEPNGAPVRDVEVRAIPRQSSPDLSVPAQRTSATGEFDLYGVVSGKYFLWAHQNSGSITVVPDVEVGDRDVNGQRITLISGSSGALSRVVFDGFSPAGSPDPSRIKIHLTPDLRGSLTAGPVVVTPDRDGAFKPVIGARRMMRVSVEGIPPGSYVKAIRVGSTDILAAGSVVPPGGELEPMEIVISNGARLVSGSVADSRSRPAANVNVALVPAPSLRSTRPDLYKATTTDANGAFDFRDVPPGDYKVFAWEFAPENIWQDASFLETYEQAGTSLHVDSEGRVDRIQIRAISTTR